MMLEQMPATMVARLRYEAAATRMMVALRRWSGTIARTSRESRRAIRMAGNGLPSGAKEKLSLRLPVAGSCQDSALE